MIGTALYNKLTTSEAVEEIVGTAIYPNEAKRGAPLPHIIYQLKDDEAMVEALDGDGNPYGVDIHIKCIGTDYVDCDDLCEAVIAALSNQITVEWGSVFICSCVYTGGSEDYIVEPESPDISKYIKELSFKVQYYR